MPTTAIAHIPLRPSASTALWAHLLPKDVPLLAPSSSPSSSLTPITPIDKNGTSMRILLHDTSHNLEKFSERVDKLTSGIDETKKEIIAVHRSFRGDHEELTREMVDLVNRCQTQLQISLGSPAQNSKLDELQKGLFSFDRRLDALDKRMDLLHTLNQTHSQALQMQAQSLQTQTQILQTLQEQHGNIMATLLPLQPLLQAVPLHIESVRNDITATLLKTALTQIQKFESTHPTMPQIGKDAKSDLPLDRPVSSQISSPRKRRRLDTNIDETYNHSELTRERSPSALSKRTPSISQHQIEPRAPRRFPTAQAHSPHFRTPMPKTTPVTLEKDEVVNMVNSHTPRCPLKELPIPNSKTLLAPRNGSLNTIPLQSSKDHVTSSHYDALKPAETPIGRSLQIQYSNALIPDLIPSLPELHFRPAPNENCTDQPRPLSGTQESCGNKLPDRPSAPSRSGIPSHIAPPMPTEPESGTTHLQHPALTTRRHDNGTPLSVLTSQRVSNGQTASAIAQPLPTRSFSRLPIGGPPQPPLPFRLDVLHKNDVPDSIVPPNHTSVRTIPIKPMSIKDRRAHGLLGQIPIRNEGKRFIPIDDNDEDDDFI